RSNALTWYWTVYIVVIGGVLGFSSFRQKQDRVKSIIVAVLYVCFAYKNLGAIGDVTEQRMAVLQSIKGYPVGNSETELATARSFRQSIEPTLVTPEYGGIRNFHILCDVLTISAIWAMERRRRLSVVETPPTTP